MTVSSGNIIDGVYFRRFGELCFFQKFLTINQNCISLFLLHSDSLVYS